MNINLNENEIIIEKDTTLNGAFLLKGNEEIKKKITIVHKKQNVKSRINIKAVVLDSARFDLEILLKIEKGAKNTDTYLKIDCLSIGEKSFVRAVPSLEINENEVKAGHGATIGYIDENMMNYLLSKGLSLKQSEELFIEAFIALK